MKHLFLLLAFTLFLTHRSATACTCLPLTFEDAYEDANSVVIARVETIRPQIPYCVPKPCNIVCVTAPCVCPSQPCSDLCPHGVYPCKGVELAPPQSGNIVYGFKFLRLFKGCPPITVGSGLFEGLTAAQSAACGVSFSIGDEVMLNLPPPTFTRPVGVSIFYSLNICQMHRLTSSLTKKEWWFLREQSSKPDNMCRHHLEVAA